jgi:hypothetical protein
MHRFALAIGFTLLLPSMDAPAHEWYTGLRDPISGQDCCSGQDCDVYPTANVTITPQGYVLATGETIAFKRTIPSWDAQYHRCEIPLQFTEGTHVTRCFIAPSGGL